MTDNEVLVSWLMCCEAMEKEIAIVLDAQIKESKDYPEIASQLKSHLQETKVHRERLETCLKEFDEKPNLGKDMVGTVMGIAKGIASDISYDKIIRNCIIDFGVEHYEMAAYTAIIEVAKRTDHPEIVEIAEEIYQEESRMADWLEKHLPPSIEKFLDNLHKKK